MKIEICAMYDAAAQVFGRPFFVQATGMAVRSFGDEVRRADANNDLYKHPEDFSLYHLGSFDDNMGVFTLPDTPVLLVRGKDLKVSE